MSKKKINIPKQFSTMKEGEIPFSLAEITSSSEFETEPFLVSFKQYKKKFCEVKFLQSSPAKKSLGYLIEMGTAQKIDDYFKKSTLVERKKCYAFLYNGLGDDVEIREVDIGSSERLFYTASFPEKIIYIILIKNSHINTG